MRKMSVFETSSEQPSEEAIWDSHQEEPSDAALGDTEQAHLSAWDAVALLLGIQIGSGIFASPSRIDSNVPSPFAALFAWLFAGILAWTGATSFAELGCCFPINGGMQEYLRYMYGDAAAAVMAWTWIVAAKPSSMAILSITLVESMGSVISPERSLEHSLIAKLIAIFTLVVILLLNCISPRTTTKITRIFAFLKLLAVGLVLLAGVVVVTLHILEPRTAHPSLSKDWYMKSWFAARPTRSEGKDIDWPSMNVWASLGHFSTAIYAGLWAFSGWDNVSLFLNLESLSRY
jgi:L-type amino acid transporter 9